MWAMFVVLALVVLVGLASGTAEAQAGPEGAEQHAYDVWVRVCHDRDCVYPVKGITVGISPKNYEWTYGKTDGNGYVLFNDVSGKSLYVYAGNEVRWTETDSAGLSYGFWFRTGWDTYLPIVANQ